MTILCGRTESYLLSNPAGFLVKPVTEPVHYPVHHHLAVGKKGNPENHVALHTQRPSFTGISDRWLGEDFEGRGLHLLPLLAHHRCGGGRRNAG